MDKLRTWLMANRTSVRLAFILRICGMGIGSLASLVFARLLLRAMGDDLNGLYLAYLAAAGLGGLGDLGVSMSVAVRAGQMIGEKKDTELRNYLSSARAMVLILSLLMGSVFIFLSPWLPGWLHFKQIPGAGSFTLLFVYAGINTALAILAGYIHSVNFAIGTVTWPVLPTILIGQITAPLCHWLLARQGFPLWVQVLPYGAATLTNACLCWRMIKWAHPWLGNLLPVVINRRIWGDLATTSVWSFLCSVGNAIYRSTDRLLINAGFGAAVIPAYNYNYKLCELAATLVLTASVVSVPKITQWLASKEPADRERALTESMRLNMFQTLLGCMAALVYLGINDAFIRLWLGPHYEVPLFLQLAFAWNLAVTTSGDAALQMTFRFGNNGLKIGGLAIAATGILNLILSYAAMKAHWITGIAIATAIAQSALTLYCGVRICRNLGLPMVRWVARCWVLPVVVVTLGGLLRHLVTPDTVVAILVLIVSFGALMAGAAWACGFGLQTLADEWRTLNSMLKAKK
ncbi:MAG: hypothetical protein WCD79_16485 [Chthoniobacteraceae bacterium]